MYIIIDSLYMFIIILEALLMLYIIATWFHLSPKVMNLFTILLEPILEPVRYLLKRSVFQIRAYDISPIIAFIILSYLQQFFKIAGQ